jgi:hypothetical protein
MKDRKSQVQDSEEKKVSNSRLNESMKEDLIEQLRKEIQDEVEKKVRESILKKFGGLSRPESVSTSVKKKIDDLEEEHERGPF